MAEQPRIDEARTDPEFVRRYELGPVLGRGGMGVVHRGFDRVTGREVAIKFMLTASPRMADRFARERDLLRTLRHPNVVAFLDAGEAAGIPYLAMELIRGRTLRELLAARGGRLPFAEALAIFDKVLEGVDYVHRQAVIHRDIKPQNVFVEGEGAGPEWSIKIGDFGLAVSEEDEPISSTGEALGTATYMPPEQFEGPVKDATADVYSLGAMLYEMLTGTLPIEANSYSAIQRSHRENRKPRALYLLDPQLPPWLDDVVQAMLDKRPELRPHTITQLRARLRPPQLGSRRLSIQVPTLSTRPDRTDWAAVALLVGGLVVAGWMWHRRAAELPPWPGAQAVQT